MSKIKSKNTTIEKIFARALRKAGIVYKKNYSKIIGKPDLVILKKKIAIFCDSSFWHGYRNLNTKIHDFKVRKEFWINKMKSNIERDKKVNKELKKQGWIVLRFWDFEIKNKIEKCISKITELSSK